jgi:hypothetical protein
VVAGADSSESRCEYLDAGAGHVGEATRRSAAKSRPRLIGSIADSRLTEDGRCARLSPVPNPISTTSPTNPAHTSARIRRVSFVLHALFITRGNTRLR